MVRHTGDKLFEITATEYNGEQEYSFHYIVRAKDIDAATKFARKYFNRWYGDDGLDHTIDNDPDSFEYHLGISLTIDTIEPITKKQWIERMFDRHTIVR